MYAGGRGIRFTDVRSLEDVRLQSSQVREVAEAEALGETKPAVKS